MTPITPSPYELAADAATTHIDLTDATLMKPLRITRPMVITGRGVSMEATGGIVVAARGVRIENLLATSTAPFQPVISTAGAEAGVYGLKIDGCDLEGRNVIKLCNTANTRIFQTDMRARNGGVGVYVDGYDYKAEGSPGAGNNNDAVSLLQVRLSGERMGDETLMRLVGSAHVKVIEGNFVFGGVGLELRPGAVVEPKFLQLIGCGFENGAAEAIRFLAGRMIRITDLYASHDSTGYHSVVYFGSGFAGEAYINGADIRGGARDGLRIVSGDNIRLSAVKSANNGRTTAGDGIRIFSRLRRVILSGMDFAPFSDGNSTLQRYPHKIEAQEVIWA